MKFSGGFLLWSFWGQTLEACVPELIAYDKSSIAEGC